MKNMQLKTWVVSLLIAMSVVAFGDTFSFQQGSTVDGSFNTAVYNATADTHMNQPAPDNNYAGYTDLYLRGARTIAPGYQTSILLQFDDIQDWLVDGFEVTSARIKLTLFANVTAGTTVNVSAVLKDWTETGATFNSTGVDDIAWTEGGAWATTGETPDRTASFTSVSIPSDALAGDSFWFDIDASVVQGWLDNPSSNNGVLLYIDIASGSNFTWHSSESTAALRPVFEITGVPEPVTLGVLGCGAFCMMLKRRK